MFVSGQGSLLLHCDESLGRVQGFPTAPGTAEATRRAALRASRIQNCSATSDVQLQPNAKPYLCFVVSPQQMPSEPPLSAGVERRGSARQACS